MHGLHGRKRACRYLSLNMLRGSFPKSIGFQSKATDLIYSTAEELSVYLVCSGGGKCIDQRFGSAVMRKFTTWGIQAVKNAKL